MTFELTYSQKAHEQLKKLEEENRTRILSVLERIRIRPYSHITKLVGSPYFRLRVGDYRVILDIRENKLIILVLEIGHRKNIYKK